MGAIGFFRFNFIFLAFLASLRLCEIHITGKCGSGQARSYKSLFYGTERIVVSVQPDTEVFFQRLQVSGPGLQF